MIYDKLNNLAAYVNGQTNLAKAIHALLEHPVGTLVKGEGFFSSYANFNTTSISEARYESHKQNIDIHVVLKGKEYIECTHSDNLENLTQYDEDHDILFGDNTNTLQSKIFLTEGYFLIFFPHDAHLVGKHIDEESNVEKIVIKVAV
jgi:biofilm protein TabA